MLSRKSPSLRRRLAGLALTGSVVLAGLALTASGEGMAAQMGAKVSAALPMAQKLSGMSSAMASVRERDRTAQQQHLAAVDAREEAVQAAEDAAEASIAARAARSAVQAVPVPPSAPAAPQPPAPPVAPKVALGWTPPVPPASPAPPAPPSLDAWRDAPPAPKVETRRYRYNDQGGPNRSGNDIPTRAEIAAQVPIIDVRDGSGCSGNRGFSDTREESVKIDGVQRKKITIKICNKDIRRQARTEALRGLQEARADIAAEEELSSRRRQQILSDLDRQIARMRARRD